MGTDPSSPGDAATGNVPDAASGFVDRRLRAVPDAPAMDLQAAEEAVRSLLQALGYDLSDEVLKDTPRRVASGLAEMVTPAEFEMTTFPNEAYDQLVVARGIPFHSLCMHHLLPFVGVAHIGYVPQDRIAGLSKLARVVEHYSRDLQVQERLTAQIAGCLQESLNPKGLGVVLEAEHLCMSLRGVEKPGTRTVTSFLHGAIRDDAATRAEFLSAVKQPG